MRCYRFSSKKICLVFKLRLDYKISQQRSISYYALIALVNTLMNYKIFLSLATTARWERNVHIDRGLQQWWIHYLHITKPVICTVIYKVINYNTIWILRPQNYDEPLSSICACMVYYSPLKCNIDLKQIYLCQYMTYV